MISIGIVVWALGFLIEMLSPADSEAENWGYLLSVLGIFVTAMGAAIFLRGYV